MIAELSWSGEQQVFICLSCSGLGIALGVLFEVVTGLGRVSQRGVYRYLLDVGWGVCSAFVTFFAVLVLTGGRLHPVVFLGILIGFTAEHITIGRWIANGTYVVAAILRLWCAKIIDFIDAVLFGIFRKSRNFFRLRREKRKNVKKQRKKPGFFQKNS